MARQSSRLPESMGPCTGRGLVAVGANTNARILRRDRRWTPGRRWLGQLIVLAALVASPSLVQAQGGVGYVPTQRELAALFRGFGADPPAERAVSSGTSWDSIRAFALPGSKLIVAAST